VGEFAPFVLGIAAYPYFDLSRCAISQMLSPWRGVTSCLLTANRYHSAYAKNWLKKERLLTGEAFRHRKTLAGLSCCLRVWKKNFSGLSRMFALAVCGNKEEPGLTLAREPKWVKKRCTWLGVIDVFYLRL